MLEEAGQLGVPERDVLRGLPIGQLADDEAEGRQRLVDRDAFSEALPDRPGLIGAFRPGQVDEIEVSHLDDPALVIVDAAVVVARGRRLHDDSEDRVRSEMK